MRRCNAVPNGFIAGADIREFEEFEKQGTVLASIERGQRVFQNLARLRCPTVAAIHGLCMGGGTELSLACRGRRSACLRSCSASTPDGAARLACRA